MLRYSANAECREAAWNTYQILAGQYWKAQGSAATGAILAGFDSVFYTREQYQSVHTLLDAFKAYINADDLRSALVKISINIDLVHKNS